MTDPTSTTTEANPSEVAASSNPEEQPSYVRLAMRNMVKKKRQSLVHFFLSTVGVLGLLVGLSYLTR
ncbi:MAG: DUF3285 domain-containing protein [Spirulina sp. SIO3F2]|nr:DUF3285 domain-containing protein [Spirulina sp. SIO3F2]